MELRGAKTILRPLALDDVEPISRYANNIHVWRNLGERMPHPYSEQDGRNFVEMVIGSESADAIFAITADGEAIGCVGVEPLDDVWRKTARVGYWIGEPYWGRGIATEALTLASDYAFDHLDLIRLEAGVYAHNKASVRVLEKAGYVFEANLRARVIKEDRVIDELIYAKVRPE